jgi:hypothetical protein
MDGEAEEGGEKEQKGTKKPLRPSLKLQCTQWTGEGSKYIATWSTPLFSKGITCLV